MRSVRRFVVSMTRQMILDFHSLFWCFTHNIYYRLEEGLLLAGIMFFLALVFCFNEGLGDYIESWRLLLYRPFSFFFSLKHSFLALSFMNLVLIYRNLLIICNDFGVMLIKIHVNLFLKLVLNVRLVVRTIIYILQHSFRLLIPGLFFWKF